jgi:5,10-methylenetetrahydromethanopterin reductase
MHLGTVLDDGEPADSERVLAAAGHGTAVLYHCWDETGRSMDELPAEAAWLDAYSDVSDDVRHLAVHQLHLIGVDERDRAILTPKIVAAMGGAYTASQLRDHLATRRGRSNRGRLPAGRTRHHPRARA